MSVHRFRHEGIPAYSGKIDKKSFDNLYILLIFCNFVPLFTLKNGVKCGNLLIIGNI